MEPTFTVLTYNMHKGFDMGRRFVLPQIRDALEHADVDVVLLQETQGEHHKRQARIRDWPVAPQFEFIADKSWPHFVYGKNAIYRAGHHGNAILSRFPIETWENVNVSAFPRASRSMLHGIIRLPEGSPLHVLCIHFDFLASERQKQISVLCQHIDQHVPYDAPLVVAGDFNDWMGLAEKHMKRRLGMADVFRILKGSRARTFPSMMPVLPVDRIYFRGVKPMTCQRLSGPPWHRLSDHVALQAAFQLQL